MSGGLQVTDLLMALSSLWLKFHSLDKMLLNMSLITVQWPEKIKKSTCWLESLQGNGALCTWSSHLPWFLFSLCLAFNQPVFLPRPVNSYRIKSLLCICLSWAVSLRRHRGTVSREWAFESKLCTFKWTVSLSLLSSARRKSSDGTELERQGGCVCVCGIHCAALSRSVKLECTPGPRLALIAFLSTSSCCIRVTFLLSMKISPLHLII